ncbi:MAG: methyltransferase domain-containing protein [Thermodesulfobacteriota bacterium]|nr:methyltransferase domain-containing protein [Thermodesulfobacteriota bacterium]
MMSLRTFVPEAFRDFRTIAAVAPSSGHLARAMLKPLPLRRASTVVELGAGTGAMTQVLLNLLPDDATLIAFEINSRFFHYLKNKFSDPRLVLLNVSAEKLGRELRRLGCKRIDAAVSSLGLGYMAEPQRHTILREISSFLNHRGVFTHFQYIHGLQFSHGQLFRFNEIRLLRQYFGSVHRRVIWRNLPPAFVFICSV